MAAELFVAPEFREYLAPIISSYRIPEAAAVGGDGFDFDSLNAKLLAVGNMSIYPGSITAVPVFRVLLFAF